MYDNKIRAFYILQVVCGGEAESWNQRDRISERSTRGASQRINSQGNKTSYNMLHLLRDQTVTA